MVLRTTLPGVPQIDMTLHDWEDTPVLTNAPVLTHDQCKSGLKGLWAR